MSSVHYPALDERFQSHTGPFGGCPIQFEGHLQSGEFVYARARETFIEVEVYACENDFGDNDARLGHYREPEPYDAGQMPVEKFVDYIVRKVDLHLANKQ